jgi:hypothetical protein
MKPQNSVITKSHANLPRSKPLILAASVTAGVLMGIVAAYTLCRVPASADPVPSNREFDLAINDTIIALLANESAPRYIDKLDQVVGAGLAILHPDLVLAERRKDPAFVQAEAQAAYEISHPVEIGAELSKDPVFRRECEDAARTLAPSP